jgi:hypothetical protein
MNYNDASIIITPNAFKAGKLYAVKGADLSVSRATSATRVNANGLIETVASNVPRIDYTGGGCPSILVEPQRTNSILNSATVATQTIVTGAVAYTLSFYGTGTITLSGTHTATVVGLGTARKTYTFTPTAGILILTVSGTCTNGQLEAGSYATSYIPTTSAIVTRNADVISKTGISDLIGQTEGVLFVDGKTLSQGVTEKIISISDGTANNLIYFSYSGGAGNQIFYVIVAGGVLQSALSVTVSQIQNNKIAIKYKNNNCSFWLNGSKIHQVNSASIPTGLSVLKLSYPTISLDFEGYLNSVQLYKTALTDTELTELTTI